MGMDIKQKDSLFASILYEHFVSQGQNPFFVPIEHFADKDLKLSDVKNALLRFKRNGLIKTPIHCFGFWEIDKKTKKTRFEITSTERSVTDDDTEVYRITINPQKFPTSNKQNESVIDGITFDKKANRLAYRGSYKKFHKAKGRARMFEVLWNNRQIETKDGLLKEDGDFVSIPKIAVAGGLIREEWEFEDKKATVDRSVRDAIQDFRDAIKALRAPVEIQANNGFLLVVKE